MAGSNCAQVKGRVACEEISFIFKKISDDYERGFIEHQDCKQGD